MLQEEIMSNEERSLLWLDDDAWTLQSYQRALIDVGFKVQFCTTVDRAVRRFRKRAYDLVIWDNMIRLGSADLPWPHHEDMRAYGGIAFYKWVLMTKPTQKVVLYTSIRSVVQDYFRPDRGQFAFWKGRYNPGPFAEVMRDLL